MRFFSFHLMPYIGLDPSYDGPAWVTCPNTLYDPAVGSQLYNRYLDELVYAEELGFDGVCVNEHHQNAYGLMPSPNLMASALARETSRMKIAVVGNALPLYDLDAPGRTPVVVGTSLVAGAEDGLVPAAHAEVYAAELPNARLEVVDQAAHWLPLERPEVLAALIRSFVADLPRGVTDKRGAASHVSSPSADDGARRRQ